MSKFSFHFSALLLCNYFENRQVDGDNLSVRVLNLELVEHFSKVVSSGNIYCNALS